MNSNKTSLVAALVLGLGGVAQGATITTADGDGADAFLERRDGGSAHETTNYGTDGNLRTRYHAGLGLYRKSYLRFDLSGITQSIVSASFELTANNNDSIGQVMAVYGLTDGVTGEGAPGGGGWSETGITWNNAPANDLSPGLGVTGDATLLGTFAKGGMDAPTMFTDPALVTFLNNDSNGLVTLIVGPNTTDDGGDISWYSKEAAGTAPALSVTVVPEPSSMVLLLIVAAGGLLRFRGPRNR